MAKTISERALNASDPQWHVAGRAHLIEALAFATRGQHAERDEALARANQYGARWNDFEPLALTDLWTRLERLASEMTATRLTSTAAPAAEADDEDEIIDIYDADGHPQGQAASRLAHATGLWHRSFHCWIVVPEASGDHKVLLQRRGPYAKSFANFYDMSVAGHYRTGEGVEGGIRECREELGIEVVPAELRLIARRTINEELYNGTVNREFQDIYATVRNQAVESYRIGYPELGAVVECSLRGLLGLVSGTVASVPCHGVRFDTTVSQLVPFDDLITLADLISEARAYHQIVFPLLGRLIDDGTLVRQTPGAAESIQPAIRIADGSLWSGLL
jgi:isopentenyldiphosphate isomerase